LLGCSLAENGSGVIVGLDAYELIAVVAAVLVGIGALFRWTSRRDFGMEVPINSGMAPIMSHPNVEQLLLRQHWGEDSVIAAMTYAHAGHTMILEVESDSYHVVVESEHAEKAGRQFSLRPRQMSRRSAENDYVYAPEEVPHPLGMEAFDHRIVLNCDPHMAMPLLSPKVTRLATQPAQLTISGDTIRCTVSRRAENVSTVVKRLIDVIALAQGLSAMEDKSPDEALLHNLKEHKSAGARLVMLNQLIDRYPRTHPSVEEGLAIAAKDSAPMIRLPALRAMGPAGTDGLWEMVTQVSLSDLMRSKALSYLATYPWALETRRDLLAKLTTPTEAPAITLAALVVIERQEPDEDYAEMARQCLTHYDSNVARVAARVLGKIGGRESVLLLRQLADEPHTPDEVVRAANDAANTIVARLGSEKAGSLTLSSDSGGQVGLVRLAGEVSVSEPETEES
jgi:hypothetical protein